MADVKDPRTDKIIGAFYEVYNTLGYGFLEKVYENALVFELRKRGHRVEQQVPISVFYDDVIVGEYLADIVVDGEVILELKAAKEISEHHTAQLLNYLKATRYTVGLVLNFGPKAEVARKIMTQRQQQPPVRKP